jgi:hypothetical protein
MKRPVSFFIVLLMVGCAASTSTLPGSNAASSFEGRYANPHSKGPGSSNATTAFTTSGKIVYLSVNNGPKQAFYIKGVDYEPTQICSTYLEPLDNKNAAIWQQDLPSLRNLGVNAVRVYNVGMKEVKYTWTPRNISQWLTAAYHNGNQPIYTVLEINFPAGAIAPPSPTGTPNPNAVTSLSNQYYELAKTYGSNPDVMGITIGGEVNGHPFVTWKNFWKLGMNQIIAAAKQGYHDGGGAQKLLMTSFQNDVTDGANSAMAVGTKYKFPTGNFVWGYDVYGGLQNTLSYVATQQQSSPYPFVLGEWGEPVGYHPHPNSNPSLVEEWPWPSASPSPAPTPSNVITAYLDTRAQDIYGSSMLVHPKSGVDSGGFYFEWSDEWWAADQSNGCQHLAGPPASGPPTANFPSGFWDNSWFGLNAVATPSASSSPDVMTTRPTYSHLQADFAGEK